MRKIVVDGFVRVNKRVAEKRYNSGEVVYLCPLALRPGYPWHPEVAVSKGAERDVDVMYFVSDTRDFADLIADFAHFNCCENGIAYYIKEVDHERGSH